MANEGDAGLRGKLSLFLVIVSAVGVILLGLGVILAAAIGATAAKDAAQLVLSSLLPLLGTWVGTVLAYYYSKENFEAASRGQQELVRSVLQRLQSTSVADKMMPAASVFKIAIPAGQSLHDVAMKTVSDMYETPGGNGQKISRLLFVNDKGVVVTIMHKSVWLEMLQAGAKLSPPVNLDTDKLEKILGESYPTRVSKTFEEFVTGTIAHVAQNKTVADAKAAMESIPLCQDVIVTQSGSDKEPMLGWVSNVDIARLSQA
jgi:hypothetical protein